VRFIGARANNLKGIDVELPLNLMVAVTGVFWVGQVDAGSRRHTQESRKAAEARPIRKETGENEFALEKVTCRRVERAALLTEVVLVDQSPIGRTPRRIR